MLTSDESSLISVPFSGESMRPLLRPGDILWCRPGAPLRVGGVYLLHDHAGLVAHRLVSLHPKILFKGDRSRQWHVARGRIWGEVLEVERAGRRLRLPSRPWVLALLAWLSRLKS